MHMNINSTNRHQTTTKQAARDKNTHVHTCYKKARRTKKPQFSPKKNKYWIIKHRKKRKPQISMHMNVNSTNRHQTTTKQADRDKTHTHTCYKKKQEESKKTQFSPKKNIG